MKNKKIFLILICGASGSGKTTLANYIKERLGSDLNCAIISQDNFYLSNDKIPKFNGQNNYDHPKSFDWAKINKFINAILKNKDTELQVYDFKKSQYSNKKLKISNEFDVFIFEGIYTLFDKKINERADLKLYIDTELDECLIRRIERDVKDRNRSIDVVIKQWREIVKPMHAKYIWNLRLFSDLIIPSPSNYNISLSLLDSGIKGIFKNKNE